MLPLIILWILLGKEPLVPINDVQPIDFERLIAQGSGFSLVVLDPDGFAIAWEPTPTDESPIWRPEDPMDRAVCFLRVVQVGNIRAFQCRQRWVCEPGCKTTLTEVLPGGTTVWRCLCR